MVPYNAAPAACRVPRARSAGPADELRCQYLYFCTRTASKLSTCRCCSALSPRAASLIWLKRSSKLAMLRAIPPVDDSNGKCAEVSRLFRSAAAKKAGESGSGTLNPDTLQQLTGTKVLAYWYKNSKNTRKSTVANCLCNESPQKTHALADEWQLRVCREHRPQEEPLSSDLQVHAIRASGSWTGGTRAA